MARSSAEIIAFHMGWDITEVRDARYQSTRLVAMAVYPIGDDLWMCCPAKGKKPLYSKEFPWKPLTEYYGRTIYYCTVDERSKHNGF
jgi:hypothetical protein